MERNNIFECGGFYFIHNFDSGNLGHVERVPTELIVPAQNSKTNQSETPDYEFNLWTRPDCAGTEFENGNRTWFYFGMQANEAGALVRLNLINLNKQGKMYNQGMAPVTRTLPGKPQWERIRDRPIHSTDDNTFTLSFKYRTSENTKATTFFAFTYPFSFAELQIALNSIDMKMLPLPAPQSPEDIYYCRECLVYSLEGRRVDLLTISSHHGITTEREERLRYLFPESSQERPFKFPNKKVIFISARVHPGETPSSFVFNGFLNLLLNRNDPIAMELRRVYVFKMIPFLNPDGVARGHYRTDTRGVNLNRVYLCPSLNLHPTIFASRSLIRYYHYGCEKEDNFDDNKSVMSRSIPNISENTEISETKKKRCSTTPSNKTSDKDKKLNKTNINKSTTTLKTASLSMDVAKKEVAKSDNSDLVDQVYDMNLQERPSQASAASKGETTSILNDNTLRSWLGSTVHISTSEELNIYGANPLRPLRDTLKNSISLLMESSSSNDASADKESHSNVKMGWCQDCRQAVTKLEDTMPGITDMVPGYTQCMAIRNENPTYRNIEEYREHQKQQVDERQRKIQNENDRHKRAAHVAELVDKSEVVYFCTNCFKRYVISNNEEVKVCSAAVSKTSLGVSGGDAPERPEFAEPVPKPPPPPPPPAKEEKSKSAKAAPKKKPPATAATPSRAKQEESGLYLYIDLHGHASKKGIFMYGNHFDDLDSCVECMLLPRIMSLNNLHFHFSSCNFTERNMYLKDRRDGMSREGSGRVAVLKATGLVRSYTLECNYNTGRLVNVLPPALRAAPAPAAPAPPAPAPPAPPKYTPHIFEEVRNRARYIETMEILEEIDPYKVGRSLGASILDLTGLHPNSRIPCSEHRNLPALREWLRAHSRTMRPQLTMSRLRSKPSSSSPSRVPYARSKGKVTDERKENAYTRAPTSPPLIAPRTNYEIVNMNMKFAKKNEPVKTTSRTRYLLENEPKPKTLATKRRNILAIRKPNSSKTQVGGGVVKAKASRRSVDDNDKPRTSLSKRSFTNRNRCRAMASSSSEESPPVWPDALANKRRAFAAPAPIRLKKIRLKTAM